jgi:photosystem II stability/assembly factor-like uncharacterized protein
VRGTSWFALLGTALAVAGAGCGSDEPDTAGLSDRLVDVSKAGQKIAGIPAPLVNSLELDERSGELLLTTNRGFFRIDPETDEVERQQGTVTDGGKSSPVGTFLEIEYEEPGVLIGSGHPDQRTLPQFLGFIRSDDDGRTWEPVSRIGTADLHKIVLKHDRLYAWDAVLSAMLISEDEGRTFSEHFTPRGLIIDFEVDPEDPARIVAATEDQLFRSEDEGEGWRPILAAEGARLAWPEPESLIRADRDGTVHRSADGGDSWDAVGRVDGEPYKLEPVSGEELYMALSDGTLAHTTDGGANWEYVFEP